MGHHWAMSDESRQSTKWVGVAFPAMVTCRVLGAAISPLLFAHLPVLLIVMSPFLIHLVAVAPLVNPAIYFPVAIFVTTVQALLGFFFGALLGQRALSWLLERIPIPDAIVRKALVLVRRGSAVALFCVPGPVMGVIAGVADVPKKVFAICVVPAQALWVTAAFFVGEALLEYIEVAREFVIEHALLLTGITVSIGAARWIYEIYRRRRRRRKEAEQSQRPTT